MNDYHYLNSTWRSVTAFIAVLIFLLYDQSWDFATAFSTPFFYLAFSVSFVAAMLIMFIVQRISIWLDRRAPWRSNPWRRSALQFTYGVLIPAVADTLLMAVYFAATGKDMVERGFFEEDLPIILLFLLGLNILYFGLNMWYSLTYNETELFTVKELLSTGEEKDSLAQLGVKFDGGVIKFDVRKEVLYFYRDKDQRKQFAVTVTGRSYVVNDSIEVLAKRFKVVNLYQINPSVIVNIAFLTAISTGPRRDTKRVVFKKELQAVIGSSQDEKYRVTSKYIKPILLQFRGNNVA